MSRLKQVSGEEIRRLHAEAAASPRKRKNLNLHPVLEDPVQRLFNALEPGTYVRPHRHARPEGWELMLAVKGSFAILLFDDLGTVMERLEVSTLKGSLAAEIPAQTWHAVAVLEPGTCMFEVKRGPYSPVEDKDFAAWAPREDDSAAAAFATWFFDALPGDRPPSFLGRS